MKNKFFPLSVETAEILLSLTSDELYEIMQAMVEYDFDGTEPNFCNIEYGNVDSRVCEMCWLAMQKIAESR